MGHIGVTTCIKKKAWKVKLSENHFLLQPSGEQRKWVLIISSEEKTKRGELGILGLTGDAWISSVRIFFISGRYNAYHILLLSSNWGSNLYPIGSFESL